MISIQPGQGIGDCLFITPTLELLKRYYPKEHINVNTFNRAVFAHNPHVNSFGQRRGIFCAYPDPNSRIQPTQHHILSDFHLITNGLSIPELPELKPVLYWKRQKTVKGRIGVQAFHKMQWHGKKVWPYFADLPYEKIPIFSTLFTLFEYISSCELIICAEGALSHIARAYDIPAIVIYGGFARPEWNGYAEHINLVVDTDCGPCYNPDKCLHNKKCFDDITVDLIIQKAEQCLS